MKITPKFRERLMESARLAAEWYTNNQNTEEHPWGGVHESADFGRYVYEYFVARQWSRGMGVWGQAVAIMGLFGLERAGKFGGKYARSAVWAGEYLKTLQIVNPSDAKAHGGFREHNPQSNWSFPRDAATGGMGFCALYRETGCEEYLERARMFARWYHDHGSDKSGWPYGFYDFDTGVGDRGQTKYVRGDWQAGGGLCYYWLYKLTGEKVWMDYFRQMIDPLVGYYEKAISAPIVPGFHGEVEISYGNDDFAIIALLAAYRHWREKRMLDALTGHMKRLWTIADEDGTYPSFAGTFVCTINNLEYLQLCREENLVEDIGSIEKRIIKSAAVGMEQQETRLMDLRAYGGFYGQSSYGVSRERIHHRSTGYSLIMNLRIAAGGQLPYYSSYGWETRPSPAFEVFGNPNHSA
ncbi:MAG: hypothetical protein ACE15C_16600 [Phycisphaerae bacterium]